MILKRYIADNMQDGIETVKKELGSEAVILNTKPIGKKGIMGFFKKSKLEILVAYDPHEEISINPVNLSGSKKDKKMSSSFLAKNKGMLSRETKNQELDVLENKITNMNHTLNTFLNRMDQNFNDKFANYSKEIKNFANHLLENEVKDTLVYRLADTASRAVMENDISEKEAIQNTVAHFFGKSKPIVLKRNKPVVILFVGITGVGKTTTLSKLATVFAVGKNKSTAIITTDTYKIASSEQLKIYSDILNIPLSVIYHTDELQSQLDQYQEKDIIFIDTGKCPDESEYQKNIMDILEIAKPDETYIVINANASYKSLENVLSYYQYIKSFKIIVTKLDEAQSFGTLFNIRDLSNKAVCYVTDGQVLTENIDEFDCQTVIDKLLG